MKFMKLICRYGEHLKKYKRMLKRKIAISIEGLIGSGKSTLLNTIQESYKTEPDTLFVHEPVEGFKNCKLLNYEYNPLKEFYQDKPKSAVAFQFWVNKCYENQLTELCNISSVKTQFFMDRCMYSSIVFLRTLHRLKIFSDFSESLLENEVLTTLKKFCGGEDKYGIDKLYYINTPIDICIENIVKRDRSEEKNLQDLKRYLQVLDIEYKLFLYEFIKCKGIDKVRVYYHPDIDVVKQDFLQFMNN